MLEGARDLRRLLAKFENPGSHSLQMLTSDYNSLPASDLEDGFWYRAFSGKPLSPGREKLATANDAISFLPSTFD